MLFGPGTTGRRRQRDAARHGAAMARHWAHKMTLPSWNIVHSDALRAAHNNRNYWERMNSADKLLTGAAAAVSTLVGSGYVAGSAMSSGAYTSWGERTGNGNRRKRFRGDDPPDEGEIVKKREVEVDSVGNMTPEEPVQERAGRAAVAAAPSSTLGRQTEVTPFPKRIKPGLPEYLTTKLVYQTSGSVNLGAYSNTSADIEVSVSGIHDIFPQTVGYTRPNWRDYFTGIYDYYTVSNLEYEVEYEHAARIAGYDNPVSAVGVTICVNDYGIDRPSFTQSAMELSEDLRVKKYMLPCSNIDNTICTISGSINHNDYVNGITEIKTDAMDNTWTPIAQNPAHNHCIRFMPRNNGSLFTADALRDRFLLYRVRLVYTVQFKESRGDYKFGGPSSAVGT